MPNGKTSAPASDEIELSLFGPGYGECIVVHLGSNNWMVVDSCAGESQESVALEYLESLGVDVSKDVKLVVASHWHDDHIDGLCEVVRFCSSARFACSMALLSEEFMTLVSAAERAKQVEHSSGVAEFTEILRVLEKRTKKQVGPDEWAMEGRVLIAPSASLPIEVTAISPSSQTITDAQIKLAKLMPNVDEPPRRVPGFTPNDLSVAMLVKAPGVQLLLGADLETGADARRGWQAVIAANAANPMSCSTYKVAHHGSDDADHPHIWQQLLTTTPNALISPYARGRKLRPSDSDISRIKASGATTYCTVWPPNAGKTKRPGVDRTIDQVTKSRRTLRRIAGHLRLRVPINGPPSAATIERLKGAVKL